MGAGGVRRRRRGSDAVDRVGKLNREHEFRPRLALGHDVHQLEDSLAGVFLARAVELGLAHARSEGWATSARALPDVGNVTQRVTGEGREVVLVELDDTFVQLGLYSGSVFAMVAAGDEARVTGALARLPRARVDGAGGSPGS